MLRRIRRVAAVLAVAAFLALPAGSAFAMQYSDEEVAPAPPMVDIVVMRPLGLVTTILGTALMAPVAVIMTVTAHPQEMGIPARILILNPARFTFVDPIGTH